MNKVCNVCKISKSAEDFYKRRADCKDCQKTEMSIWQKGNPQIIRARRLKRDYGISQEDYNNLKEQQKHQCLICLQVIPLQVDHNHSTGKIRGLLCGMCNKSLGLLKDNPDNCDRAANYLRSS